jgi:hypothetical protein
MATATKSKTAVVSYDDLSPEIKAIMDRAVRTARNRYWCDRFSEEAPQIFNVKDTDVVDSDGLSCKGYDREGFNKDGYNRDGYNREGFSSGGYDKNGYDKDGFNAYGLNKQGTDRQGRDKYRYDVNGYDSEGYDYTGQRARRNRDWYTKQAARPAEDFEYDATMARRPAKKTPAKTATKADAGQGVPRVATRASRAKTGGGY